MPLSSDNLYRIAQFLLTHDAPFTLNRIGHETGVPQSSVNQATRWLRYHRALRQREGRWAADPPRLLDLLASARRPDVVPARTLSTRLDEAGVSRALRDADIDHALAYLTAANHHLFYQPERRLMVAVARGQATQARRTLAPGDQPVEIFERDLAHTHTTTDRDRGTYTDLLETAIDVRAHPDGGPHAALLEQAVHPNRGPQGIGAPISHQRA